MKISKLGWLGALVVLAAVIGLGGFANQPVDAQAAQTHFVGSTKVCNPPAAGTLQFTCNLNIIINVGNTLLAGETVNVTITGAGGIGTTSNAQFVGTPTRAGGNCNTTNPVLVNASQFTFSATAACVAGTTVVIQETLQATGAGGGPLFQNIDSTFNFPPAVIPAVADGVLGTPFVVPAVAAGGTFAKSCVAGNGAINAGGTTVRVGEPLSCTVTVTAPATGIAGGTATVTLTNALFISGTNIATFTCGTAIAACTSFTEVIYPQTACVLPTQSIVLNGITYNPAVVGPGGAAITVLPRPGSGIECPGAVAALTQPAGLAFTCTSSADVPAVLGDPVVSPVPGGIFPGNGYFLAGVAELPQAIICKIRPVNSAGVPIVAPPAKIEVSSINSVLIDAAGRVTTNLRIECGDINGVFVGLNPIPATNPILPTIQKNTCNGVQVGVAGNGVGISELNARYEPAGFAVADGIFEVEAKAFVGFVAPQTSLSLAISPNPTIAGATGTATVRFNRVNANCGDIIGGANRPTTSGAVCIDTATGNTLLVNNGTVLNGNVVYLIQDTNVAQWATQQPNVANPVVPTNLSGFVTSPNQTVVRCGYFAATSTYAPFGTFNPGGSSIFTSGVLASYFGGCETTVATYRAIQPGVTNITATFIPDLPGAYGQNLIAGSSVPPQYAILGAPLGVGFNNVANPSSTRGLEVVGAAPVGDAQLAKGCNNISPTVTESANAYAARVSPSGNLIALWEHQAASNTFRGWSPQAGAPNDLAGVTRLRPIFVCVSNPSSLAQPAA